jgi:protein ImuA
MTGPKADIIAQLQKDILPLQGYKPLQNMQADPLGLEEINASFPQKTFPLAAIHEFVCEGKEDLAAAEGFISGILSSLNRNGGASMWIGISQHVFPPALKSFGLDPERILFVQMKREKDVLWAMEEALQCNGINAVIAELKDLSFNTSRKFQLAVEKSGVTGFIIRDHPRNLNTTASISRWKITPLSSSSMDNLPGVGFPRWQVDLNKIRNGKPGSWHVEWAYGKFNLVGIAEKQLYIPQRKTG